MPVKGWIDVGEKHCQGCPFCLIMMEDASRVDGSELKVLDITETIALRLE